MFLKQFLVFVLLTALATSLFAKGEVHKIYAHYEEATPSQYSANGHTYKWGQGKNIVIDGFEYNGHRYNYTGAFGNVIVKVNRVNNDYAVGTPCELFSVIHNNDVYQYESTFPQKNGKCDMATVLGGRVISVGALDLFRNDGASAKNIERVDFITPNGITAPSNRADLEKAGHVVTEKSGNNPLKIAAILSIDANGKPTSYGPLVGIHTGDQIDYGLTTLYFPDGSTSYERDQAFLVDNKYSSQGHPHYNTHMYEPLGMAFVSLADLGISAGQKYYGFSYFGRDVTSSMDLTKPKTFPQTTGGDTADPYGGVAGYFVDESLPVSPPANECPSGYTLDTSVNYIPNGDFHILDERSGQPSNVSPGKWLSQGTWKSDTIYQGNDRYPNDWDSANDTTSSIIVNDIVYGDLAAFTFPGDSNYGMGAQNALYSNGNDLGHTISVWQSKNIKVDKNSKYLFVAHFSNALYKDNYTDAANPKVQLSFKDSSWHKLGSPFEVPRDNATNDKSKSSDKWYKISHVIEPSSSNISLRILDSAFSKGNYGDDLVTAGLGLYKCKPKNQPKPFQCTSESFISFNTVRFHPGAGDSQFDTISLADGSLKNHKILKGVNGVNSIGYNIKDNYIWGYNLGTYKLVRIDADGNTKLYDRPTGLPKGFFIDADVDKNGVLYLAEDNTNTIYRVDVNPDSSTFLHALTPLKLKNNVKIRTADFAFNPKDGKLYYIDNQGKVYKIDPSSGIRKFVIDSGVKPRVVISFFDKDGNFYFNLGKGKTKLYKINMDNPSQAEYFTDLNSELKNGDGARCPLASIGKTEKIKADIPTSVNIVEGDHGKKNIKFSVTLDQAAPSGGITISYATSDGTAKTSDADYENKSGSITIPAGSKKGTISIKIKGDKKAENDEYFYLKLSSNNKHITFTRTQTKGNILNDDYDIVLNASTNNSPFTNAKLTTQIVNKKFKLTISAWDRFKKKRLKDLNITGIDLIKPDGSVIQSLFTGLLKTNSSGVAHRNVVIPSAYRNTTIKITGTYKGKTLHNKASDNFAIRPKKFVLQIPTDNIAGRDFNITAIAKDAKNNPSTYYNENIGTGSSCKLTYTEQKSTAVTGTMNLAGMKFTNGKTSKTTQYSEVGSLKFTLAEIPGKEFAAVDASDTNDTNRYIEPVTVSDINFKVDHFDISNVNLSHGSTNFTYYAATADMQNMAATLSFGLKAMNAQGAITQNYSANLYAQDVNITLNFDTESAPGQQNVLAWQEDGNTSHAKNNALMLNGGKEPNKSVVFDISKLRFTNGEANAGIKINFNRNIHQTKEPLRLTVKSIQAVNCDNRQGSLTGLMLISDFYYGRLHASDYMATSRTLDAKIFHEVYCKKCDRNTVFTIAGGPESVDQIHWYQLTGNYNDGKSGFQSPSGRYHPYNFYDTTTPPSQTDIISSTHPVAISNKMDMIQFKIPKHLEEKLLPYKDRIEYQPVPWLVYKHFTSSNTKHHFNIDLSKPANEWAGQGNTGMTVDLNVSGRKNHMKIDW